MKTTRLTLTMLLTAAMACACATAQAQRPEHPAYIHALEDLRYARGLLDRLDDPKLEADERHAIHEIDAAINEIKLASVDDGKDLADHPPIDAHLKNTDRFHKALELLQKAHNDCSHEEDNPHTQGLQARVIHHIDEGMHAIEHTIQDALS